jgi:hypothetical protein
MEGSNLYNDFKCKNGHKLTWTGATYAFSENPCNDCGNHYKVDNYSSIRWKCNECKQFYCQVCYPIFISNKCPINHDIEFQKLEGIDDYTCDVFFKYEELQSKEADLWVDMICNLGYCLSCKPLYRADCHMNRQHFE